MKKTWKRAALLAGMLIVMAVMTETALRIFDYPKLWSPGRDVIGSRWNEHVHRRSRTPGLLYELAPGVDAEALGVHVRTNSLGMRGPEISPAKPGGVFRIVVLGDSVSFGWGVPEDMMYSSRLAGLLDPELGPVEVANMAVSGYGTAEEVAAFLSKGAALDPDLVVLGYVLNDPSPMDPVQPLVAYYQPESWWRKSNTLRLLRVGLWRAEILRHGGGDYIERLHADPETWGLVESSFSKLSGWARETGAPVVVAIFPDLSGNDWPEYKYGPIHEQVAALARDNGFLVVDLYQPYSKLTRPELTLTDDDPHPSVRGHGIAAREIADTVLRIELRENGQRANERKGER